MLFRIERFAGINNVDDRMRVAKVEIADDIVLSGDLTSSINFRITKDGIAKVRNGQTLKVSGSDIHSLWTNKAQTICFYVDGTSLKRLNPDFTSTTLYTVTNKRRMSYIEHNNIIFMGNGAEMLKYKDGSISIWGDESNISDEFEMPQRVYRAPNLSNILLSYRSRVYVAWDRFVFYSEPLLPERFRRSNYLTVPEKVTAMSYDNNGIYIHTLNTTTPFVGTDPTNFQMLNTIGIGAIKHGAIQLDEFDGAFILSKRGWAYCSGGTVKYIDYDNFRLDLPDTAEAYLCYDIVNNEILANVLT